MVAVLFLSLPACCIMIAYKPSATFFLGPTRAWELLAAVSLPPVCCPNLVQPFCCSRASPAPSCLRLHLFIFFISSLPRVCGDCTGFRYRYYCCGAVNSNPHLCIAFFRPPHFCRLAAHRIHFTCGTFRFLRSMNMSRWKTRRSTYRTSCIRFLPRGRISPYDSSKILFALT